MATILIAAYYLRPFYREILASALLVGIAWFSYRRVVQRRWQAVADRARAARDTVRQSHAALLAESVVDDKTADRVARMSATALLGAIHSRQLSAETVMRVFVARAARCGVQYNSNTQEMFAEAIDAARELDRRIKRGEKLRPLDGLPISVKDHVDMRGTDSTCGCVLFCLRIVVGLIRHGVCVCFPVSLQRRCDRSSTTASCWRRCARRARSRLSSQTCRKR